MADISKLNVNNTEYNIKDATARSGKTDKSDLTAISITGTKNDTGSVIPINKFFYLNGELVIAKTDIADNATLTENTNYIKITAGILNGLYNVLQDVTPTSSDKLLVVQSQGQGLAPHTIKMDSANPTGTGKLSMNRASGSVEGVASAAIGDRCEATASSSIALGYRTVASGTASLSEGLGSTASGEYSHAENDHATASGNMSHAQGQYTIAQRKSQFVFGEYNVADTGGSGESSRGTYVEIVGKGTGTNARSNARTLDWAGNEVLAGGLKVNGNDEVVSTIYSQYNWANSHTFVVKKPATYLLFTDSGNDMAKLKIFADNVAQLNSMLGSNIQSVSLDTSTMTVTITVNNKGLCAIRLM